MIDRRPAAADAVAPTRDDPVVRGLSEVVGGPVGTRAGRHPWWTPVRVLLALTAICFAVGMAQKTGCVVDDWRNGDLRYAQMCYSDLPYLYTGRGLAELEWPYTGDPQVRSRYEVMEYPVGIAYFAWVTAWVTHWLVGSPDITARAGVESGALWSDPQVIEEIRVFVVLSALGFAVLALLATWLLAGVNPRRPWDAAAFAAAPVLAATALINWDLLAVTLVAGALWAWARERPALTGVLVGLGVATKLYPLFLLGGILVICVRQRRWRALTTAYGAAAAAWLVANLPALLSGREQWRVFWEFNSERTADLGSLWLVASQAFEVQLRADTINAWSWLLFALWCAGVALVGLKAPSTPRLAQLAFLVVAGFLLVNKVYSPQYVLWLLPLAALARPRWSDQIVWQGGELFYFAMVWWYLGGFLDVPGDGPTGWYWLAVLVRVAAEIYLVVAVVRDVLRPERDPVDRWPAAAVGHEPQDSLPEREAPTGSDVPR